MPGRGGAGRVAGALLALALLVCGCAVTAGEPASESSWTDETDKALGSALSSLGTARLVLERQVHGRLQGTYAVVSLRDALRVLQTETSGYLATQPPVSRAAQNAAAAAALQEAITVLNRAAVAGPGSGRERRSALDALDAEYRRVEDLQQKLVGG